MCRYMCLDTNVYMCFMRICRYMLIIVYVRPYICIRTYIIHIHFLFSSMYICLYVIIDIYLSVCTCICFYAYVHV